jgi:hypothetical protein
MQASSDVIDTSTISEHSATVKPGEQHSMMLGEYTEKHPPKGFAIELSPDPFPDGSVETQINTVGNAKHSKYVLFVANYGTKPIHVEVRQL